jgi:hypothetical protein
MLAALFVTIDPMIMLTKNDIVGRAMENKEK